MDKLKNALTEAFEEADKLQQAGNGKMGLLKLKLKEAASFVSPELSADFHGKIGVGATTIASTGRKSFAWEGEMPGAGKGRGKKPGAALRVVDEQQENAPVEKGIVTEENDNSLLQKIATTKPTEIADTYAVEVLDGLAASLAVTRENDWSIVKYSSEIRKAAKAKLTPNE